MNYISRTKSKGKSTSSVANIRLGNLTCYLWNQSVDGRVHSSTVQTPSVTLHNMFENGEEQDGAAVRAKGLQRPKKFWKKKKLK